jgi:N-acetylmuramoyl-L-alanine amidase
MRIINKAYSWAAPLSRRSGDPRYIIWHHAAAKTCSPDDIHRMHLANGWSGIGYHFFVRKDGRIYRGRPIWAIGAHAKGFNDCIGICAEGAYHVEKTMPKKQLEALQWLHDRMRKAFPKATDKRHRDVNATACPGAYYPWKAVTGGVTKPLVITLPVPETKPPWWGKMLTWLKLYKRRH